MNQQWRWKDLSPEYANFGNANQWTVSSGLESLAREATQNSNDAIDALGARTTPAIDFSIIRPTGARRTSFETALRLDQLRPHLEGMAKGNQIVSGVVRDGLAALDAGQLLLLRISDYGAIGLDGPEFLDADQSAWGNFVKLCRTDLFSGKNQAAGGSFGLGKAVYWRFSRFQTALFLSNAAGGTHPSRLFGVNQGTAHDLGGTGYEARGFFGVRDRNNRISSLQATQELARALCLDRNDSRPGTSALVVGFYDPDDPEADLDELRQALENGIDQSFWPLLARDRIEITVSVEDGDEEGATRAVDPARRFPELTRALQRFDLDQFDDSLEESGNVVALPIRIKIPKRKTEPKHNTFDHVAQLVVTRSDADTDPLENKTALFRKSEMVVQTLDNKFPDVTYHAFLIAGVALDPFSAEARLADDFLRYAEPPAHDMWIPTGKAPQTSLGVNYVAPYLPNLRAIRTDIRAALEILFGVEKPPTDKGPTAILRHLAFLNGKGEPPVPSKPVVDIVAGEVDPSSGEWVVAAKVRLRQPARPMQFELLPLFAGEDGGGVPVRWSNLDVAQDGTRVEGNVVRVVPRAGARQAVMHITGRTDARSHPVAAHQSGLRLEVRHFRPQPSEETES